MNEALIRQQTVIPLAKGAAQSAKSASTRGICWKIRGWSMVSRRVLFLRCARFLKRVWIKTWTVAARNADPERQA